VTAIVVSDAGPLIALGRIEQLNLIKQLYKNVLIPPAVHNELHCSADLPGATALQRAINDGWISIQSLPVKAKALSELRLILDAGESEAIVLAELVHCRFLLMDERRGRQVAKKRGLKVIGIAGVLLAAKSGGLIETVAPVLNSLSKEGYRLSGSLIAGILKMAKEL
jgi:predicted nucleic acid-binding protein